MELCVLGSGSSGNCAWIGHDDGAILLDAGFSLKEITARIKIAGLDIKKLKGVLVTHEHSDHTRGLGPLSRGLKLPVFINRLTFEKIHRIIGQVYRVELFETGSDFVVDGIKAHPFSTSHDSADPCAFVFGAGGKKMGFLTDLGHATTLVKRSLTGLDYLVVESNHDMEMLMAGPYPWSLKKRIASRQGHLSNADCAALLEELVHPGLQGVTLAHLSETNNNPDLARLEAKNALGARAPFDVACQGRPLGVRVIE
ncbi:MAG: MBL fold metallo-hydrolase [Nitrospinota bacterium]|nr:MBL fold metallo-hydrolase [Nitrospinota bacterium]